MSKRVGDIFVPEVKRLGLQVVVWSSNNSFRSVPWDRNSLFHKSPFLARLRYGYDNVVWHVRSRLNRFIWSMHKTLDNLSTVQKARKND
jgi:hypothetical protein